MNTWLAGVAAVVLGGTVLPASANGPHGAEYAIVDRITGPDGMWDYAAVDVVGHRLYVSQTTNISILDLADGHTWSQVGLPAAVWHGVLPLAERGQFIGTNGQSHAVHVYDAHSKALIKTIPVSTGAKSALDAKMTAFAVFADPDALVVDPRSGLVAAINGGSGEVALVDLSSGEVVARVQVGGKLEFAVVDGGGHLYVNVQSSHEIAVIDIASHKVTRRIAMRGCVEPKGLAYDAGTDLLISGCDNGIAKFIIASSGHTVATLRIGEGADAVIADERRHRAFVPSPADALLRIFDIHDPGHIRLVQTLATERGVRLAALDPGTGRLYLPAAKLGPPVAPYPWPSMVPGTFHLLIAAPAAAR